MNATKTLSPLSGRISGQACHHLTEEQLYELLDRATGTQAAAAQEQVAACAQCADEFEAVREALSGFRQAASGLAQAEFSPALAVRGGFLHEMRRSMVAWPLSLAAAGVLLAASLTMAHRPGPSAPVTAGNRANVAAAASESDEALLDGIDRDLSTSVPPSLEPLSVAAADGAETLSKHN